MNKAMSKERNVSEEVFFAWCQVENVPQLFPPRAANITFPPFDFIAAPNSFGVEN
jgi:hypothetical protein